LVAIDRAVLALILAALVRPNRASRLWSHDSINAAVVVSRPSQPALQLRNRGPFAVAIAVAVPLIAVTGVAVIIPVIIIVPISVWVTITIVVSVWVAVAVRSVRISQIGRA